MSRPSFGGQPGSCAPSGPLAPWPTWMGSWSRCQESRESGHLQGACREMGTRNGPLSSPELPLVAGSLSPVWALLVFRVCGEK